MCRALYSPRLLKSIAHLKAQKRTSLNPERRNAGQVSHSEFLSIDVVVNIDGIPARVTTEFLDELPLHPGSSKVGGEPMSMAVGGEPIL